MHPCAGSGESLIKLIKGFESKGYVVEIYSITTIPYTYVGIIHVSQNKRIELFITDDENDDDDAFFLNEDGDRQLIENFWSRELNAQHVINLLSPWKGVDFRVNSDYLTALLNKYLDTNVPGKDIPTDAVPITIKIIDIDGMLHDQKGFIINGVSHSYDPFNLFEMLGYTYIDLIYDNGDSALPSEFKIGFLETDVSTVSATTFTENEKLWICVALNKLRDLGHTVRWDEDTRTVFVEYEEPGEELVSRDVIINFANQYSKMHANGLSIGWQNISQTSVEKLNATLIQFNITSKNEINHFLAQCFVESWNSNENEGLTEINWRDYPDKSKDREYFNEKYGDRADLGNLGKNTDDGYNYRGAGYIHLTGRANYTDFANAAYVNDPKVLNEGAQYVANNYAWLVAGHYWQGRVQYRFASGGAPTVSQVTYDVNGGQNGLTERTNAYNILSTIFK